MSDILNIHYSELTNLRDRYSEVSADFTALRDDTVRLETHIQKLNDEEESLNKQLEDQIKANEKLRLKG